MVIQLLGPPGNTVIHCLKPFQRCGDFEGLFFFFFLVVSMTIMINFTLGLERRELQFSEIQPLERLSQNTADSRLRISHARIIKYLMRLHSPDIQFAFGKLRKYNHHEKAECDLYYRSLVAAQ